MQAKSERFELRLDQVMIDAIDGWRMGQRDFPSRAAAVRRLIENGIGAPQEHPTRFSDPQKLIIAMLCDMHEKLNIENGIDPVFVRDAVDRGHFWALRRVYTGVLHDHVVDEATVDEVSRILEMWSYIESAYAALSPQKQAELEKAADVFGKDPKFLGFAGNSEGDHLSTAAFFIDRLHYFREFKGRYINSHIPMLDVYRRMLPVFAKVRERLVGREMNVAELTDILLARVHPKNRGTSLEDCRA